MGGVSVTDLIDMEISKDNSNGNCSTLQYTFVTNNAAKWRLNMVYIIVIRLGNSARGNSTQAGNGQISEIAQSKANRSSARALYPKLWNQIQPSTI